MPPRGIRNGVTKSCQICGNGFYVTGKRIETALFCSLACKGQASRGACRPCEVCGSNLPAKKPRARFCSLGCSGLSRRIQDARRTEHGFRRTREHCNSVFHVESNRRDTARFCGKSCHDAWQGRSKTHYTCKVCVTGFRLSPSFATFGSPKYCSIACRNADPDFKAQLLAMNTLQQVGRVTRAEAAGYALLDDLDIDYERQLVFKGKFTPDATVSSALLLIQFDGDYWHDRKGTSTEVRIRRRVALDRSQDAYANACGWRVVRLWESDLHGDPKGCAARLVAAIADHETSSMS